MADNSSTAFETQGSSSSPKKRITIDEQTLKNLRPLVSIEYVRVNKIDDDFDNEELEGGITKDMIDDEYIIDYDGKGTFLYGTVIVTDCRGNDLVYHRHPGECEVTDEYLSLVGPSRAISGQDKFIISVNLWARVWMPLRPKGKGKGKDEEIAINEITIDDDLEDIPINKEIARGGIEWDPLKRDQFSYEQLVRADISGKRGSVTVGYLVLREALSATVKVVMATELRPRFYGTIKADTLFRGSSTTTTRTLFKASRDEWRTLRILDRPILPLARDSYITITVDLWRHQGNLSPDHQLAIGSVEFTPKFGEQMRSITTTNYGGEVQVYITCE